MILDEKYYDKDPINACLHGENAQTIGSIMKIAVLDAVRWSNSRHKSGIDLDHSWFKE